MTAVYCFSGSGHSMAVAAYLADKLNCGLYEIRAEAERMPMADTAVVVFPVYCQNIPGPVKRFLKEMNAQYVALAATYGKISYGNVLFEAQKLVRGQVIAGAYIPMGHTFLDGNTDFDADALAPIPERVQTPQPVTIPRTKKNPLADVFPGLRSRMGVQLIKGSGCTRCGICEANCPMGAIRGGKAGSKCIRCLRCVTHCPRNALRYENRRILQWYLERYEKDEYVLYL